VCNKFMLNQSRPHGTPQEVEWAYAFDVHCNAFFPAFLFTYVAQFLFLFLITGDRWMGLFIGNSLYLVAACFYMYNTFLGYNGEWEASVNAAGVALPFLKRTSVFLYPIGFLCIFYALSLFGFSVGKTVLRLYFPALKG
jgi:hypothetical protein